MCQWGSDLSDTHVREAPNMMETHRFLKSLVQLYDSGTECLGAGPMPSCTIEFQEQIY